MYSKCYMPVCDKEVSRKAFVTIKEWAESRLKAAEKKVKDLESNLKEAEEDAKKVVEEEQCNKEAII